MNTLPDNQQSTWQLTSIQLAGWTSLPILATSILILQTNSFLGAILTIIVGNAILWFIRLGIITMSHEKRQSTLDISREYVGPFGSYLIALLLLLSTFAWFLMQTTTASGSINLLLPIKENPTIDQFTQISVLLGIISTLFCMGGMVLLRKLSTFAFPLLILIFFLILLFIPHSTSSNTNLTSLSGLPLVLATNLGITADLPTFFRHSRSWATSIKALTLVQLISLAFGLISLYLGSIITDGFQINSQALFPGNLTLKISLTAFIFLSVICANVANVYSASVGWELLAPKALVGRKEYFILGLGLTTIFILLSDLFSTQLLLNISDSSLVNLCLILVSGYIISRQTHKPPHNHLQLTYLTAWLLSTLANTLQLTNLLFANVSTLLLSCIIIFLVVGLSLSTRHLMTLFSAPKK